jgi:hypothetical protein
MLKLLLENLEYVEPTNGLLYGTMKPTNVICETNNHSQEFQISICGIRFNLVMSTSVCMWRNLKYLRKNI